MNRDKKCPVNITLKAGLNKEMCRKANFEEQLTGCHFKLKNTFPEKFEYNFE